MSLLPGSLFKALILRVCDRPYGWITAFPQSGQCEDGTPGSHHSEGLCLDTGHRPLVSRGGMWGSPHQASWARVQMLFALVSFWEDCGRGEGLAGSELGPGLLSQLQPAETLPLHPCCTVKGYEERDNPSPGPHNPDTQVVGTGQAF